MHIAPTPHPLPYLQVRVVDEEGRDVAPGSGAVGEVLVRGPTLFPSYHGLPEATAAAFAPGGWFRTGDLASLGPSGYLCVVDRKKDMVGACVWRGAMGWRQVWLWL
jgi:long-subunit acyl-CoA synthetase (AMP-forming)